jgi:hypothetical protein
MPDDAVRAVAELAASQHRAFTRRQAAELNFDKDRVATAKRLGWLHEPYAGVLVFAGAEADWNQRLKAATLAGGGHAVASHRAAARLHDLDGFAESNVVELSVTRAHRWRGAGDVVVHHVAALDASDVVVIDGIPCCGLARTLCDLGMVVDPLAVRRALTSARRRGTSLRWIQLTADRLFRPGPSGVAVLMRQLATIPFEGRVPESWFEELVAICLDDPAIPPIELQYTILDRNGRLVARTDLAIPSVRLGLEAHSRRFHFGPDAEPLDEQRDMAAAACGWDLQYLGWYAARRPAEVVAVVKQIVAARRREL